MTKPKNLTWQTLKLPLLLLLLACLMRIPTLDHQSFWADEVQVVYFVDRPLLETARWVISPDNNGPLYYLLLWVWHRLTGPSDFAVRYLSALCSLLTVPVLWRLGRTWFGQRVGVITALLFAIAPFAVWFGQEAKMYALHMLLAGLSTLFLYKALRHNRWPLWLGYGITFNLLAYSHFFGAFAIAAQGAITVLTSIRLVPANAETTPHELALGRFRIAWRRLRSYTLTMIIVIIPYIPIIQFAWRVLPNFQLHDISKGFVPLPNMLREYASEYVLRISMIHIPPATRWRLLVPLSACLLLGLYQAWRPCTPGKHAYASAIWLTSLFLLPTAMFYPVSFKIPAFSPKYLSAAFPFFLMTLALSIEACRHWSKPLARAMLVGMVSVAAWGNVTLFTTPNYQRSDWKTTATYLEAHIQPDDVIVGFPHYATERALLRYYEGAADVLRFKHLPYAPEEYYLELRDHGYHTMWLILHQDQAQAPHNRMREAAGLLFPNITGIYPNNGNIAVLAYSLDWHHDALPADATPVNATFANGLTLVGYHVDVVTLPPTDCQLHPPSNWIHTTTYWRLSDSLTAANAPTPDFTVHVRLTDATGGIWGGELQRPPTAFHFDPPANWQPAAIKEAHYDVNLNPITPPGTYALIITLADTDGEPIALADGEADVFLRDIEITQ